MTGTLENLLLSHLQQYCYLPDPATYIISSAIHICFYHDMHPHLYQFKKIPRRRESTVCLVLNNMYCVRITSLTQLKIQTTTKKLFPI